MANKYLHQVTALGAAPASGDLFHITDVSDTTDLAQGTSKSITYANLLSGISITESQISDLGSYITLTDLSVGSEATASGDGAISYSNSTGVFTYTPPTLAGLNGSIDDLSDVTLTSTATNDILRWNGSAFVNTDSPTLDALQFDLNVAPDIVEHYRLISVADGCDRRECLVDTRHSEIDMLEFQGLGDDREIK